MKDERIVKQEEVLQAVLTGTDDKEISIAKLYALSDLPPELMAKFVAEWPGLPLERREKIARHLADIMEENYQVDFTPLFAMFLADGATEVRRAALDGLWDSTEVSLLPTMISLMQTDSDESVRVAAAVALGHYVLMAEWGQVNPKVSQPVVTALLAELEKPDVSFAMQSAALEAVASSGHGRVHDHIQTAYASRYERLRLSAVYAMGASADRRWLSTVLRELDHDDTEMRIEAARAAGSLAASDAVEKLEELILEDDDLEVQITAVQALGKIGGDLVNEILHRLTETEEDLPEDLLEAIEEALDEASWLGNDLDFKLLDVAEIDPNDIVEAADWDV